jgi:hypothetical protein
VLRLFALLAALVPVGIPTPRVAPANAPPKILYVHLSSTRIHPGDEWSGRIVTTTNVASVVIVCTFFAFVVPRKTFGLFAFRTHVLAVPDIYRQVVYGRIVAYNTAGTSEAVPLELDFR